MRKNLFLLAVVAFASTFFVGTYQASATEVLRGNYQGWGFTVYIERYHSSTVRWDDGTQGYVLRYNPRPNPRPRCNCDVYEGLFGRPGRQVLRRISAEKPMQGGDEYINVTYSKWPWPIVLP